MDPHDFEQLFAANADFVYSPHMQSAVTTARRAFGGQLFFDRMLANLKVKHHNLYPPHSNKELRTLHHHIVSAPIAEHHRLALLFYLLKDVSKAQESSALENEFVGAVHLPAMYWRCVEGFWYLDHRHFQHAVESLVHPAVKPPTFPEDVLNALLQHAKDGHPELPLTYYNAVIPSLSNRNLADSFLTYLARISVTEAFYFLRDRPEDEQEHLLQVVIREALAEFKDNVRANRGVELIELPFTSAEEAAFDDFLLHGDGKTIHGARDAVMTRKMATGKFQEALEIGKQLKGRRVDDLTWEPIKSAIAQGLGPRKDAHVGEFE